MTPGLAAAVGIAGVAATADYDAGQRDPVAISEGVANCLTAGPDASAAIDLLTAAGWTSTGTSNGRTDFVKGNVKGHVLSDGNCVFRSELVRIDPVDTQVRQITSQTFPKAKVKKADNNGTGLCDGYTLRQSRKNQAWIHYTDYNGASCTGFGAGVVVQFL